MPESFLMMRVRNLVMAVLFCAVAALSQQTFTNPLKPVGPDPWVTSRNGFYYYMNSTGNNLTIWKTRDVTDLKDAARKVVWTPPASGPDSHDIWAPELHYLQGKWYIYFAADEGTNQTHRLFVLENSSADPLNGEFTYKSELATETWAIDASVFENRGKLYIIWSGWPSATNGTQNIYLARLKNPWTIEGRRVLLSTPTYPWETIGDLPNQTPPHVNVNEGPEILKHGNRIFLVYSGSGCWTDQYALGMLEAPANGNLMKPAAWKKIPHAVFSSSPEAHAFGTGHNSFFQSPDGKEDWIIYHANPEPHEGCGNHRSPRAQRFTWKADGTPDFGVPVPTGEPLAKPSGTK